MEELRLEEGDGAAPPPRPSSLPPSPLCRGGGMGCARALAFTWCEAHRARLARLAASPVAKAISCAEAEAAAAADRVGLGAPDGRSPWARVLDFKEDGEGEEGAGAPEAGRVLLWLAVGSGGGGGDGSAAAQGALLSVPLPESAGSCASPSSEACVAAAHRALDGTALAASYAAWNRAAGGGEGGDVLALAVAVTEQLAHHQQKLARSRARAHWARFLDPLCVCSASG